MEPQTLHELLTDLEQELLRVGYTKGTMTFYRGRWRKLREFVANGHVHYCEQLGIDFVRESRIGLRGLPSRQPGHQVGCHSSLDDRDPPGYDRPSVRRFNWVSDRA